MSSGQLLERHGPITSFASFVSGTFAIRGPCYHVCSDGITLAVGYGYSQVL